MFRVAGLDMRSCLICRNAAPREGGPPNRPVICRVADGMSSVKYPLVTQAGLCRMFVEDTTVEDGVLDAFVDLVREIHGKGQEKEKRRQPVRVGAFRLGVLDPGSAGILEVSAEDDDQVDEGPDAQAADGEEHGYAGAGAADIEPVGADDAEKEAEQEGGDPFFLGLAEEDALSFDGASALGADDGVVVDFCSAFRTVLHDFNFDFSAVCCVASFLG